MSPIASVGAESRTLPVTSPGFADTVRSDSSACSTAGPAFSSRRCPASVSATVREVRMSNVTPRRTSSCRTDWLKAEVETPRSLAAPAKLWRRATARKEFRALSEVKAIVQLSYTSDPPCATPPALYRRGLRFGVGMVSSTQLRRALAPGATLARNEGYALKRGRPFAKSRASLRTLRGHSARPTVPLSRFGPLPGGARSMRFSRPAKAWRCTQTTHLERRKPGEAWVASSPPWRKGADL